MAVKLTDRKVAGLKAPASGYHEVWDATLPGFGIRVSPKGRRSFMCKTRVGGKQRRFALGVYPETSLADARQTARDVFDDAHKGIDPKLRLNGLHDGQQPASDGFETVAARFLEEHVKARGLRTAREVERVMYADIVPAWRDRRIHEIARADVKDLLQRKANRSPAAANKVLEIVRKLYNWALDEEIVEHNPTARLTAPAPQLERERVLTDRELALFWKATGQMDYPFGPLYRLCALTAQRRGEVASMRWRDLDLTKGTWTIPGESAKSGAGHLVPLPPAAVAILQDAPEIGGLVFPSSREGPERPVSGWSKAKRRLDKLMIETADSADVKRPEEWRVHDLRRTAATKMRELGADRLTVSKVLNHREAGVTRVYDRYSMDKDKKRALQSWADYLTNLDLG